ncbi:hypothetical protein GLOTRDRAFT_66622 [Gloeophyllum trabeum ATCC 11539]|uniref:Uncharacterized protein n=1 Tax=Gloeophyllum trabeum (strain ATCC 11539 / FP-39264 / Madison 617) TaxID=670483 RepID=S7PSW5_GLOTA|nr:uncharacterized protein GLOTRDRAFT_66622 [Gloeophyllum trabeum ATCC 11539]EPQ50901.1 hypothetical protein GLOTRDRAFT_66622 [Gloeophyllum trabeum ATCC 11539]
MSTVTQTTRPTPADQCTTAPCTPFRETRRCTSSRTTAPSLPSSPPSRRTAPQCFSPRLGRRTTLSLCRSRTTPRHPLPRSPSRRSSTTARAASCSRWTGTTTPPRCSPTRVYRTHRSRPGRTRRS